MSATACLRGPLLSPLVVERHLARETLSKGPVRDVGAVQRAVQTLGPTSSLRSMLDGGARPLIDTLGFSAPTEITLTAGFLAATLRGSDASDRAVALIVSSWGERLDPLWRAAVVEARMRGAVCCLLFNGLHLRLVDTSRTHARRHADVDLEAALDDEDGLRVLLLIASASSLAAHSRTLSTLVDASDDMALAVCRSLRGGVLDASRDVLAALVARPPRPTVDDAFEQALTIVYRILFLLFAEARGLVPLWHPIYRGSYSVDALRRLAERSDACVGFWDALRASSRLAHAGCRLGTLRVTPFNGRLFSPERTPLAERADLDDHAARRAVLSLATTPVRDGTGRRRIDYAQLGVEQLGAVYETLLDYAPRVTASASRRRRVEVSLDTGSGLRKATGTFYTPQPLAEYLVHQTLGPLVRDRTPDDILRLRILDPAMGSGAFLVAACAYLANAYEEALVRTGGCHASDIGTREQAAIRRTIAERCLYGVDRNPMAVQLARLSLWLATLAADRPLSFLDHHLRIGDSLLGAWLSSIAHPPVARGSRRDALTLPLFDDEAASDAMRQAVPLRFALSLEPNETPEHVRAKERLLARLDRKDSGLARWRRIANLWCSYWFTSDRPPAAAFPPLTDAILTGRSELPSHTSEALLEAADRVSSEQRFFHWELEFPEVFFDRSGGRLGTAGFDAIVGNPPWDMMRADSPPERNGDAASRGRARAAVAPVVRFVRDAGVYTACSDGHANRYQLFVERVVSLTRPGGRFGLVLPAGLATDHGSAGVRRLLFARSNVESMVGFENRRAVFPIHRSVRFLLLTAEAGRPTREIRCRFGEDDLSRLGTHDDSESAFFPLRVTPALLERLTGPDVAIPDLRTPVDLTIAERAATRFAPLGAQGGWHARFGRELNATDDRGYFSASGRGLPVVEGKVIDPFVVRTHDARWRISASAAVRLLGNRHMRPRLAYRDVASATNRMTFIAAMLPADCVSTHTVFCLRTAIPLADQFFLCGLFNSFVVNYLVRLRVTTHVTTAIVEQLPVPTVGEAPAVAREVAGHARRLARGEDVATLAKLNALVARLYALTLEEFAHILDTFPLVSRDDRDAAMLAFRNF